MYTGMYSKTHLRIPFRLVTWSRSSVKQSIQKKKFEQNYFLPISDLTTLLLTIPKIWFNKTLHNWQFMRQSQARTPSVFIVITHVFYCMLTKFTPDYIIETPCYANGVGNNSPLLASQIVLKPHCWTNALTQHNQSDPLIFNRFVPPFLIGFDKCVTNSSCESWEHILRLVTLQDSNARLNWH